MTRYQKIEVETIGNTPDEVKIIALLDTEAYMLA